MAEDHQPQIPAALEQMLLGLTELESVLGEAGRRLIPAIHGRLQEAMAARDRGDPVGMFEAVGAAMREIAAVGDQLEPGVGSAMAALADRFQSAMVRGDMAEAKKGMDIMFEQSGARYVPKKD